MTKTLQEIKNQMKRLVEAINDVYIVGITAGHNVSSEYGEIEDSMYWFVSNINGNKIEYTVDYELSEKPLKEFSSIQEAMEVYSLVNKEVATGKWDSDTKARGFIAKLDPEHEYYERVDVMPNFGIIK